MMRIGSAVSLLGLCLTLGGCGAQKSPGANAPVKKYQMKGEVMSIDGSAHVAKIKHGNIEGWMDAMTMDYPVKDETEFKKLSAGEPITATVFVQGQDYWLGEIGAGSKDEK